MEARVSGVVDACSKGRTHPKNLAHSIITHRHTCARDRRLRNQPERSHRKASMAKKTQRFD